MWSVTIAYHKLVAGNPLVVAIIGVAAADAASAITAIQSAFGGKVIFSGTPTAVNK